MSGEVLTIAAAGTDATTIGLPGPDGTIDIEASFSNGAPGRTYGINWQALKVGGGGVGFGTQQPASEDTVYTQEFDPPSRGTWQVTFTLTTIDGGQPFIFETSDVITVIAYAESTAETSAETRSATAGAETRTSDAEAGSIEATAGAAQRDPDATVEARTATAGVDARTADAEVETRTATGGVEE